jgi:hypothetical protein
LRPHCPDSKLLSKTCQSQPLTPEIIRPIFRVPLNSPKIMPQNGGAKAEILPKIIASGLG